MKKTFVAFLMMSGGAAAFLSGCATKTTTADLMRDHATELQTQVELKSKLAKDWERGSALVASGNKRVKDGEKRIKAGEKRIKEGEQQVRSGNEIINRGNSEIADGNKLIQESENLFSVNFPDLGLNVGE